MGKRRGQHVLLDCARSNRDTRDVRNERHHAQDERRRQPAMTTYRIRRAMFSRPEHDLLPSCALHDSFPLTRSREPKKHKKLAFELAKGYPKKQEDEENRNKKTRGSAQRPRR